MPIAIQSKVTATKQEKVFKKKNTLPYQSYSYSYSYSYQTKTELDHKTTQYKCGPGPPPHHNVTILLHRKSPQNIKKNIEDMFQNSDETQIY